MNLFVVALAPSLLWLWWFWKQDANREEAGPLARAFLWGAVAVIPAAIVECCFMPGKGKATWLQCLVIIGPVEECFKFWATRRVAVREASFDEPVDGIIFASAGALGFAFAENLGYFAQGSGGIIVVRSLLSVPCHVLFAVPWGAALGRYLCVPGTPKSVLVTGIVQGALLHGAFNGLLFNMEKSPELNIGVFVLLVAYQWRLYRRTMAQAQRLAPGRRTDLPLDEQPPGGVRPSQPDIQWAQPSGPADERFEPAGPAGTRPDGIESSGPGGRAGELPAGTAPATGARADQGLQWSWVFISSGLGLAAVGVWSVAFVVIHGGPSAVTDGNPMLLTGFVVALVLGGLLSAYLSEGYTVRESAVGLALLGLLLGVSTTGSGSAALVMAVMLGVLGAVGGWLGESLQTSVGERPPPRRRHGD
ncbi:MAG: PrsW family intramembrane metalloprotease [Candidatus Riflebacteria bacterium]|nr:PrsW family intramembrane metalloprotease [Candidatus Riflebacteria bacterium]